MASGMPSRHRQTVAIVGRLSGSAEKAWIEGPHSGMKQLHRAVLMNGARVLRRLGRHIHGWNAPDVLPAIRRFSRLVAE